MPYWDFPISRPAQLSSEEKNGTCVLVDSPKANLNIKSSKDQQVHKYHFSLRQRIGQAALLGSPNKAWYLWAVLADRLQVPTKLCASNSARIWRRALCPRHGSASGACGDSNMSSVGNGHVIQYMYLQLLL